MKKWYRRFRYKLLRHFVQVLRSKTSDRAIAFGFAVGTFIALLPTPGLNWVLAFGIALVYKKINKLSLFFAIVFWNPLLMAPVYALCYVLGGFLFDIFHIQHWESAYLNNSGKFMAGNIILTSLISLVSYHLSLLVIALYKKRREKKMQRKKKADLY